MPRISLQSTKVEDLMADDGTVLNAHSDSADVSQILGIPISRRGCSDRFIWHFTHNGDYTVKWGYKIAMQMMEAGELGRKALASASERDANRPTWMGVWKLRIPNKLKNFVWCCCNNALAVRWNLQRRHVRVRETCGLCAMHTEEENHLFFECEFSRAFGFGILVQLNLREVVRVDFIDSWKQICLKVKDVVEKEDILQSIVFGLWHIWKCSSAMIFNKQSCHPMEALELWRQQVVEFRESMKDAAVEGSLGGRRAAGEEEGVRGGWKKPKFGTYKLKCDAAWCSKRHRGAARWLLRDFAGLLVTAGRVGKLQASSAVMAEAAAIREALWFCRQEGYRKVVVESDSQVVIRMAKRMNSVDIAMENILYDIWASANEVGIVSFEFTCREGNRAAHVVAVFVQTHGGSFS